MSIGQTVFNLYKLDPCLATLHCCLSFSYVEQLTTSNWACRIPSAIGNQTFAKIEQMTEMQLAGSVLADRPDLQ